MKGPGTHLGRAQRLRKLSVFDSKLRILAPLSVTTIQRPVVGIAQKHTAPLRDQAFVIGAAAGTLKTNMTILSRTHLLYTAAGSIVRLKAAGLWPLSMYRSQSGQSACTSNTVSLLHSKVGR